MDPLTYEKVATNGIELEVSITNRGGGRGLALLLHGFPELAFSWRFQIPLLAEMGYEVWAPNTRGYGRSDRPPKVSDYRLDTLLDDVAGLIEASGHERVTLVAHDWGAVQAWAFAMRGIRPLERLVIMNVPHPACMARELRRLGQLRRSWYVFFFQIPRLPEWALTRRGAEAVRRAFVDGAADESRFPVEVTDVYREAALRPGAMRSMVNYYRALVRGAWRDRKRRDGPVEVPTLMLWGLEDVALSRETTEGTDEHVRDLTLRYLPGVSHWVQQEAPEKVNVMLAAWLDGEAVPDADSIDLPRIDDPALDGAPGRAAPGAG